MNINTSFELTLNILYNGDILLDVNNGVRGSRS